MAVAQPPLTSGLHLSTFLVLIGLSLNVIASVILFYPLFKRPTLDDGLIVWPNRDKRDLKHRYDTKGTIRLRRLAAITFALFIIGFAFQIAGVVFQSFGK